MTGSTKAYKVKVGQVIPQGKHNTPWVVTWPTDDSTKASLGSITFAAKPDIWDGTDPPKQGEFLVVEDVRQKPAGWNAHNARYFRPEDQNDPNIVQ